MEQLVRAFCEAYERANSISDFAAIGGLYAETFLFAGPHGAQAVKKEDFLKVIPRMKAHFALLGLADNQMSSAETEILDSRYALVKVGWSMTLRTPDRLLKNLEIFATYILQRGEGDKLSIVFQLDHQDLASVIADASQHRVHGAQPTDLR
jgi:hypothetical protein